MFPTLDESFGAGNARIVGLSGVRNAGSGQGRSGLEVNKG